MECSEQMGCSTENTRDSLVSEFYQFVQNVARQVARRLGLPNNLHEEIEAAGLLGLVEAAERYDPAQGAFKAYAWLRIRGSIVECLRSYSEVSGTAYKVLRALAASQDLREQESLVDALVKQTTSKNLTREQRLAHVLDYAAKSALAYRLSIQDAEEEMCEPSPRRNPEQLLLARENADLCLSLVESLPREEREIVESYYFKGHSFIEIARASNGHTKSWVSRIHARALARLRQRYLKVSWGEPDA